VFWLLRKLLATNRECGRRTTELTRMSAVKETARR
jgi:hypothetical protein